MNLKSLEKAAVMYQEVLEYDKSIIELESFISAVNKWDKECVVGMGFVEPVEVKSTYKESGMMDFIEIVMTPRGPQMVNPRKKREPEQEVITHSFEAPVPVSVMFRIAHVILDDIINKRMEVILKLQNLGVKI